MILLVRKGLEDKFRKVPLKGVNFKSHPSEIITLEAFARALKSLSIHYLLKSKFTFCFSRKRLMSFFKFGPA